MTSSEDEDNPRGAHADLLVIGAGTAGVRTVQAYRRAGGRGSVVVFGDEPDEPYDRPPLSKAALVEDAGMIWLRADWAGLRTSIRLGAKVVTLDPGRRRAELAMAGPSASDGW